MGRRGSAPHHGSEVKLAIVLGGGPGVWLEAAEALEIIPEGGGHLYIATNRAGVVAPRVDHWVSFHVDHFPKWIEEREARNQEVTAQLWTAERRKTPVGMDDATIKRAENWAGSSGLLAVTVALEHLGCDRVICAGVPLDQEQGHFDDPKPWRDAVNYRIGWTRSLAKMAGRVRSMSGWTMQLLGAPSEDWLNGRIS